MAKKKNINEDIKELKNKIIEKKVVLGREVVLKNLRAKNSEFRELSDFLKDRATPTLVFWPQEDPLYFKPGIKQKWVDK
mgnify:CR=1 FL=1